MAALDETSDEEYTIYMNKANFLGRGVYGDVYKGRRNSTQEDIAIKRIYLRGGTQSDKLLDRELRALASIKHPNVVKLYDTQRKDEFLYLYMEYCEERDLDRYLETHDMTLDTKMSFIQQSGEAVLFMHTMRPKPFIHRDLKPSNFLITVSNAKPMLKIGDLGFALEITDIEVSFSGTCGGTISYMAPEVRDRHYSSKADIFSLGIVYEAMLNFNGEKLIPMTGRHNLIMEDLSTYLYINSYVCLLKTQIYTRYQPEISCVQYL